MENKFNIEEVNAWLKDEYGMSYDELSKEFNKAVDLLSKSLKQRKEMREKINEVIELCETEKNYIYDDARHDENTGKLIYGNKIELDVVNKSKILNILKEDK